MDRFKRLARGVVAVTREELAEKEREYAVVKETRRRRR